MKKKGRWLLYSVLTMLLMFCLVLPASADGPPTQPHSFYGTVTIAGGSDAPVGTVVTAKVGGVLYGSYTTTVAGQYGDSDPLQGDWLVVQGDIATGATIDFYVGGAEANEKGYFYSGTFTELNLTTGVTDTTPPTVSSVLPVADAVAVAVGTTVSVTFSEAMASATITTSSFTLDSVAGSVSYGSGIGTATFTPSTNLADTTTYTATLSTAITDIAGNPLSEAYTWSFTTELAPNQPPDAEFTYHVENPASPGDISSGDIVSFDASNSSDPDGTLVSYEWYFGDGEAATGCQVDHRFRGAMNEPKNYGVTLTVQDNMGAIDTDAVTITVAPLEKIVEVTHEPAIPVPGQPVFARMTVSYNWIHDGTYVISRIHYESGGFIGIGAISIWDFHSHAVPMPRWAADIFSFGSEEEETYSPILEEIHYGGDIFQGIEVDAYDAMNVYITGLAGISISIGPSLPAPFFETNSACFQPDYTEAPDVPVEAPSFDLAHLCSPGELRIYDSEGRVTGLVNGEIREEIPNSSYKDGTVIILCPSDSYCYEVVGTNEGSYGLGVASVEDGEGTTFSAIDIPVGSGAVHRYAVDWSALSQERDGVTVQIDSDGDGIFEQTITSDNELTHDEFMLQTATTIDFDPAELNLKSKGTYVTVFIELPRGYHVGQIDVSSIMLNEVVPALTKPTEVGDYDGDGIPDLMVKFDRAAVQEILQVGEQVEVTITGKAAGVTFQGADTIRVLDK